MHLSTLWLALSTQAPALTPEETLGVAIGASPAASPIAEIAATPAPAAVADSAFSGGLEQLLLSVSTQSATAILYLLLFLSVLSFAIAVERYLHYRRERSQSDELKAQLVRQLDAHKPAEALAVVKNQPGIKAAVLREGLANFHEGPDVLRELMESRLVLERNRLDRRLIILGTIGNNAPFIGLLGTVMGIIRAFHDLARAATQGPNVVMAGISEALVATAVGLFVAIPAVVFFNYFKSKQRDFVDDARAAANIVLAFASRDTSKAKIAHLTRPASQA
ncbi:MotA/TolQ/ExbB proton channel family protein [bacterium]|nr:MotA/TolQ/ExbB proton channel family protein [bacterium]